MATVTRGIDYQARITGGEGVVSEVSRISGSLNQMSNAGNQATSGLSKLADVLTSTSAKITFMSTAAQALVQGARALGSFVREGAALADAEANFARIGLDLQEIQKQSSFTQSTEEIQKTVTATYGLVKGLGLSKDQMQSLYNISAGLADAYNKDLQPTIKAVAAAANGSTRELRQQLGVYVDTKGALKRYAESLGIATNALSTQQKVAAYTEETLRTLQKTAVNWPTKDMVTPIDQVATAWDDMVNGLKQGAATAIVEVVKYTGVFERLHKAVSGDWSTPQSEQLSRNEQELKALEEELERIKDAQTQLTKSQKENETVYVEVAGKVIQTTRTYKRSREEVEALEQTVSKLDDTMRRFNATKFLVSLEHVQKYVKATTVAAEQAVLKAQEAAEEEAEQQRQARERASQAAAAQLKRDQDLFRSIIEEGEQAAWDAVEHTEEENIKRRSQKRAAQAQETIKNALILSQALAEIASQEAAAIERASQAAAASRLQAIEEAKTLAEKTLSGASQIRPFSEGGEEGRAREELETLLENIQDQAQALADARSALIQAAGEGGDEVLAQLQQISQQEMELDEMRVQAQLEGQARIAEARERDEKRRQKADRDAIRRQHDLTEAQQEAVSAQVLGLTKFAEAGKLLLGNAGVFQAAEMLASGIQAGADAAHYAAESIAAYASGNIAAGTGYAAAAAASTAAAIKYAAGLAELGAKGFHVDSSPAEASTSGGSGNTSSRTLTGESGKTQTQELTVNLTFQGESANVGRYLIDKINSEAYTKGGAKINSSVIRRS